MDDLEAAIKIDPSNSSKVFNTGAVKPDDDSNPTALQKKDFDTLIAAYPNDYRPYLFRGLFYFSFTNYDEQYYTPTFDDLNKALDIDKGSALANYAIGTVFQKQSFWSKAAASDASDMTGASGGYKEKTYVKALGYFQQATKLDPKFADSYAGAAEELSNLKKYIEAIPQYDKVIELAPNNYGAYNDRGLAKTDIKDIYGAINDFSKAIEIKKAKQTSGLDSETSYEHRAAAYIQAADYNNAIADYSRAIGLTFASHVFLMSLSQIRSIYPELADITDKDLLEGLRKKYYANMSNEDFASHYAENTKSFLSAGNIIANLYGSRGDTYLKAGNFKRAASEYARALHAWSQYAPDDRWKVFASTPTLEYSLDVQTLDFGKNGIASLWVKELNKGTQNYNQQNYQVDCSKRKIKSDGVTYYDGVGNALRTMPAQNWQSVIPESNGEVFYLGMCGNR